MATEWTPEERAAVDAAMAAFPVESGKCAALARVVFAEGRRRDAETKGLQIRPKSAARYILPKTPRVAFWHSHTYVETHAHAVDALTGTSGCEAASYLGEHWRYSMQLDVVPVDVESVDRGIEDQ